MIDQSSEALTESVSGSRSGAISGLVTGHVRVDTTLKVERSRHLAYRAPK